MPSLMLHPYALMGAGALLIASHGVAYVAGRGDGFASVQAKYMRATEKAMRAMRAGERAIDDLNGRYAVAQTIQDRDYATIRTQATPILLRPIYDAACVDADGVGLLDRARALGNLTLDPGEPAGDAARTSGDAARP